MLPRVMGFEGRSCRQRSLMGDEADLNCNPEEVNEGCSTVAGNRIQADVSRCGLHAILPVTPVA